MKKALFVAIACAVGASACSSPRELTDAQITTLLRAENASATDANAPLDGPSVECLRAWSGDAELQKHLPVRLTGDGVRKSCRAKLEGWLGDASRNAEKFGFADVSAAQTVRRAMALLDSRAPAAAAGEAAAAATPPATSEPAPLPGEPETAPYGMHAPDPTVDLGAHGVTLRKAESTCQQVIEKTRTPNVNPRVGIMANYCSSDLGRLRTSMENHAKQGDTAAVEREAAEAQEMIESATKALQLPPTKH